MSRNPSPARREAEEAMQPVRDAASGPPDGALQPGHPSLAGFGVAGISRRRVAWFGLAVLAAWIVVAFAGQAAEASRATARVAEERGHNAEVAVQTEALRRELEQVAEERWVLQQARAYRLGSRSERPFALAPDAAALAADAPGSPARRLGAAAPPPSPLEGWLEVLFGPARGG